MAVTLVAGIGPTKTQAAGDELKNLTISKQSENRSVSFVELKVNEKADFKFLGAADWKELGWKWTSSDKTVATVDQAGVVTARSEGFAVVSVQINTYKTPSVAIYVTGDNLYKLSLGEAKGKTGEKFTLETGDLIDLNFYGASSYKLGDLVRWSSANPSVATVDQKGVVHAVSEGSVTVLCGVSISATKKSYIGRAVIDIVRATAEVTGFTIRQTGANTMDITFPSAEQATDKIDVAYIVTLGDGSTQNVVWVVDEANTRVEGRVLKLSTFVPFNKAKYVFTINGVSEYYDAGVGDPYHVSLSYKNPVCDDELPQVSREVNPAKLVITDSKGIALRESDYTIRYELVEGDKGYVDEYTGGLNLFEPDAEVKVRVSVTYGEDDDEKTITETVSVKAEKPIPYSFLNYAKKYAVISEYDSVGNMPLRKSQIDEYWDKTDVIVGSSFRKYVVVLLEDENGISWSLSNVCYDNSTNDKGDYTAYPQISKNTEGNGYYVEYTVTDSSKAFVDRLSGQIIGVTPTDQNKPVYVLVTLFKRAVGTDSERNLGIVAAVPVYVSEARSPVEISVDTPEATVLTSGDFTEITINAAIRDQYGDKITTDRIVDVTASNSKKVYSSEVSKSTDKKAYVQITSGTSFRIDAKNFKNEQVSRLVFEITTYRGLKTNFTLNVKKMPEKPSYNYTLYAKSGYIGFKDDQSLDLNITDPEIKVYRTVLGCKYSEVSYEYGKPENGDAENGKLYLKVTDPKGEEVLFNTQTAVFRMLEEDADTHELEILESGTYGLALYMGNAEGKAVEKASTSFKVVNELNLVPEWTIKSTEANSFTAPLSNDNFTVKINGIELDIAQTVPAEGYSAVIRLGTDIFVSDIEIRLMYEQYGGYIKIPLSVQRHFVVNENN